MNGKKRALEGLSLRLEKAGWLWYLPLILGIMPVWQSLTCTCLVPRADHWTMYVEPYLEWVDGGSFWDFLQSPGTDSRHNAPKILHILVILLTRWNLQVESMICVVLGVLTAAMILSLWRRHAGPLLERWLYGWLSTFCILSPIQWMNWVWGVQICYTLLIAASVGAFWMLSVGSKIPVRVAVSAMFAVIAIFSFLNGWIAWGLGLVGVVVLAGLEGWGSRKGLGWALLWLIVGGIAAAIYVSGWPAAKPVGEGGVVELLKTDPGAVILFFLRVLGGSFAELAPLEQRADRHALQNWSAPLLSVLGLGLMMVVSVVSWVRRKEIRWAGWVPWVMILLFGLGNAAAITVARVGKDGFLVFQSRYPSFTLWFWVGLLGLCCGERVRWLRWLQGLGITVAAWGMLVGAWQGWRDGERDARQGQLLEAGVAMRAAAVEPVLLDGVRPRRGEGTVELLDRLDALGLLHVAKVPGPLVKDAKVDRSPIYLGEISEGRVDAKGLWAKGWAIAAQTRRPPTAVVLSWQQTGGPETWLGIATRLTRERNKAAKNKARVFDDRIGWGYEPLTGGETSFMSSQPLQLKRGALPVGEVTLRAYGFDAASGVFSPLKGEINLRLP